MGGRPGHILVSFALDYRYYLLNSYSYAVDRSVKFCKHGELYRLSAFLQALEAILGVDPSSLEIPKANDVNSQDAQACVQMDCGQTCPSGYIQMTGVYSNDACCPRPNT